MVLPTRLKVHGSGLNVKDLPLDVVPRLPHGVEVNSWLAILGSRLGVRPHGLLLATPDHSEEPPRPSWLYFPWNISDPAYFLQPR